MDMRTIIQGQMFWGITDWLYSPQLNNIDYNRLENTFDINRLRSGDIIYTHTMYAKMLNDELSKTKIPVIVVSHNADETMDFRPAPNIKMWFSQNVNIQDERVRPLPIGLENDIWLNKTGKINIMQEALESSLERHEELYVNHSIKTNPKERNAAYAAVNSLKRVVMKSHSHSNLREYVFDLKRYRFILSPEGNGIDCHRTWEALYMGCIPVLKRNVNTSLYEDLPVVLVNDWSEVTDELLEDEYRRIQSEDFNYNKLTFNYWRDKIWDMANGLK